MQHRASEFRLIITVVSVIFVVIFTFDFINFRNENVEATHVILPVLVGCLFYLVASVLFIGRHAATFKINASELADPTSGLSKERLASIAATPNRVAIESFGLTLVYLGIEFFFADQAGLRAQGRAYIFIIMLSTGMLGAYFNFVFIDRLTMKFLLDNSIMRYPLDLRETRQQKKIFIIPVFMTFMTFLFAFSMAMNIIVDMQRTDNKLTFGVIIVAASFSLIFVAVVILLAIIWASTTARIYKSVVEQLDHLTSAEQDLTKRISICSVDEFGSMAGMVNYFCGSLTSSMKGLKEAQAKLASMGERLERSANGTAGAVSQISSGLDHAKARVNSQSQSVEESASAVEEIAKNIESLNGLISDQSASVTEASASIEEMIGNIGSVTMSIERMAEQFRALIASAEEGKAMQADAGGRIGQIVERSQALLEANKVISTIASQTNLLAMNAAIEAAHAGEAGHGFSVVADEIRRLSETSASQSKKIKTELSAVQKAIEGVVVASKKSEESFDRVAERIGTTDALVRELQEAMTEQKEGSAQVLEALKSMNEITTQVRVGSQEMSTGNKTVLEEIVTLRSATQEIKGSIEEMSSGAGEIAVEAREVSEMAKVTMETIDALDSAIGGFKTE
jgi:methyl-accepting chemotaxis protein